MSKIKQYTQSNRQAWNDIMPAHQRVSKAKLDRAFMQPGYSVISPLELAELNKINFIGKNIAHLCCNNGIELMSLKNLGAARCVGFDISDVAIEEASNRALASAVDCQFVRTDVFDIADEFNNQFDIVYITIGCLGWIPDLKAFFAKAAALLKPEGTIFVYELHPVTEMLSSDDNTEVDPLLIIEPYFKAEPYEETSGLDYLGKTNQETATQYWFVWTLSDIMMAIIEQGFSIVRFLEYDHDISETHGRNQAAGVAIPMSYILVAER